MTKNSNAFMPLYVGDYLADTTMLTRDQHGGYLLLIMTYWRNRGPLPDEDDGLAMATRSTPAEWKKLRPLLQRFFDVKDGLWSHKRIDDELKRADEKYEARVNASRKANAVRHGGSNGGGDGPPNGNPDGSQSHFLYPLKGVNKKGRRAAAQWQAAAPPAAQKDWADAIPAWAGFKPTVPPTVWQNFFAICKPNGSPSTLIAPSSFVRDQIESRYGKTLDTIFNGEFQVKTENHP